MGRLKLKFKLKLNLKLLSVCVFFGETKTDAAEYPKQLNPFPFCQTNSLMVCHFCLGPAKNSK